MFISHIEEIIRMPYEEIECVFSGNANLEHFIRVPMEDCTMCLHHLYNGLAKVGMDLALGRVPCFIYLWSLCLRIRVVFWLICLLLVFCLVKIAPLECYKHGDIYLLDR